MQEQSNAVYGPAIAKVILWQNGMVMVFDTQGRQVPEFQGPVEDVRARLKTHGWPEERWRRAEMAR